MSAPVVFLGPSLPRDEAERILPGASVRAPAQAGDVYRAVAHDRAATVVLVDGVFGTVPSVWHKELLHALAEGCRVVGAASMGALRAAECGAFGMTGVGWVHDRYASGQIEADDEVAVAHEDAEGGHRPLSVPFVTLRRAGEEASLSGRLPDGAVADLLERARAIFFADRTWDRIAEAWSGLPGGPALLAAARHPDNDVKAHDARAALRLVAALGPEATVRGPRRPDLAPEDTAFWARLRDEVEVPPVPPVGVAPRGGIDVHDQVDVVRRALLDPAHARLGRDARLWVHLVRSAAEALGIRPDARDVQARSEQVRRRLGLLDRESTARWLAERGLDVAQWHAALALELTVERLAAEHADALRAHVPVLVARAGGWRSLLPDTAPPDPVPSGDDLDVVRALADRPGMPFAADMPTFATRLGFASLTELVVTATSLGPLPSGPDPRGGVPQDPRADVTGR